MIDLPTEWHEGSKEFAQWLHTLPDDERQRIISIMSLHKYFAWADQMRRVLVKLPEEEPFAQLIRPLENSSLTEMESGKLAVLTTTALPYMPYLYGGLYVVVEGWKELGLSDPRIDELLKSPLVELLRRYRNGSFHYQKDFFDNRFVEFLVTADSEKWIRKLRDELSRWFLDFLDSVRVRAGVNPLRNKYRGETNRGPHA